jgi:hypothetical protein
VLVERIGQIDQIRVLEVDRAPSGGATGERKEEKV